MPFFLSFIYAFCLAMILPLFFPFWHLFYFAPFLILCFYRYSLVSCLWWSILCGLIVDLFSAETRIGIYAINYSLTTFCLYRYKFHFFEDRFSTLPTMTFGFTCLSTLIQVCIFYLVGKPFALSWEWVIIDLFIIPLQMTLYALLAFAFPSLLVTYFKRRYFLFRLNKRRS